MPTPTSTNVITTQNDIANATAILNQGGSITQNNIRNFYNYFSNKGHKYPNLAIGLLDQTFNGVVATNFLKNNAESKYNITLSPARIVEIQQKMALAYLAAMNAAVGTDHNKPFTGDVGAFYNLIGSQWH